MWQLTQPAKKEVYSFIYLYMTGSTSVGCYFQGSLELNAMKCSDGYSVVG